MAEVFTVAGLIKIAQIMLIDILLAGDNAIVIGMAARKLPAYLQKKAIFFGTFGAIAIRFIMAFLFVEALHTIPYLHLVGGLLLLWIALSLIIKDKHKKISEIEAKPDLMGAITTIVVADGVMGIDNVLGVVAAAEGHMALVIAGMLVSVPIIIWGSTLFIKIIDKYPAVLYIGGAILAWVAAGMIIMDESVKDFLEPHKLVFSIAAVAFVFIGAKIVERFKMLRYVQQAQALRKERNKTRAVRSLAMTGVSMNMETKDGENPQKRVQQPRD